ncbi:MAG: ABC transporter ATP-binding protein, partial [Chloroflexi bacterium]|nr:ABC transporter ATP-binding protein [Chloroflexota bacterium]
MNSGPASASPPAIAVAGLRKSYGGIQALTGVDLAITPG